MKVKVMKIVGVFLIFVLAVNTLSLASTARDSYLHTQFHSNEIDKGKN